MEGTLSKWTNVVHGWQHRYFVLNDDALCYYTSKEKMARGQQRGCIRLRGAALGIDEENNAQFTIAVDGKVFHLQGKSRAERDTWVRVLERVIHEKCGYYRPPQEDPLEELRKRVIAAENQSQTLMEQGTLSKWTNVVHGWQHRYFVLNDDALCYYTSKEKMARGQQRGCIRLRGAALGIDEENNAQFTIAVDGKVFHLQGKSRAERDTAATTGRRKEDPLEELRKRVIAAENQSQTLMEQTRNLEQINARESEKAEQKRKKMLSEIIATAKRLQSTVDHSCILLRQVQRDVGTAAELTTSKGRDKVRPSPAKTTTTATEMAEDLNGKMGEIASAEIEAVAGGQQSSQKQRESDEEEDEALGTNGKEDGPLNLDEVVSYSSSDDEFYDATEDEQRHGRSAGAASGKLVGEQRKISADESGGALRRSSKDGLLARIPRKHSHHQFPPGHGHPAAHHRPSLVTLSAQDVCDWGKFDEKGTDYDAIYNNTHDEQDIGDVNKQHGSVLMHLLSQVSVGMDLTKVTLPTFILERRSLLEMYADFFAHPDDFVSAVNEDSAEIRFLAVLKYYLNSFFPARKSGVAKKPYNPILGETFRCRWTLPDTTPSTTSRTKGGPFPGSATNQVTFIAEQVSHHPPISAFYVEHPEAGVSCTTHIYTKSSFLGLSIGVQMIGKATVRIHKNNETYTATFPNGYGRAIMATPWFELSGKVELRCEQTGYRAEIEFQAKPFFRGKAHQIHGQIFHGARKNAVMQLKGEWNGHIYLKRENAAEFQLFTDVRQKPDVQKECVPVMEQEDRESRKLWRHVTAALFTDSIEFASQSKRWIEQRQRDEKAERERLAQPWQPRHFIRIGDGAPTDAWRYCDALEQRMAAPEADGP
uniref:Oxysterol-binding protein n=1 Tax=Globodera pallida TaxID=36090 RepID=A0A183BSL3_GLOPA